MELLIEILVEFIAELIEVTGCIEVELLTEDPLLETLPVPDTELPVELFLDNWREAHSLLLHSDLIKFDVECSDDVTIKSDWLQEFKPFKANLAEPVAAQSSGLPYINLPL